MNRDILFVPIVVCMSLLASAANAQMTVEEMQLIDEGRDVFDNETFDGNGRTCGTCHIAKEAYNIFPATIKKLRGDDKKLVFATNVPGLENVALS